jgi:hypothetical protein
MKVANGHYLDAQNDGGVMVRVNSAHGSAANLSCHSHDDRIFLYASKDVDPGTELTFDYNNKVPSSVKCNCKGRKCEVFVLGCTYPCRGCTGFV